MKLLIAGTLSALLGAAGFTAAGGPPSEAPRDCLAERTVGTRAFADDVDEVEVSLGARAGVRIRFQRPSAGVAAVVVFRCPDGACLVIEEHADGEIASSVVGGGREIALRPWMREYAVLPTRAGAVVSRIAAAELPG